MRFVFLNQFARFWVDVVEFYSVGIGFYFVLLESEVFYRRNFFLYVS